MTFQTYKPINRHPEPYPKFGIWNKVTVVELWWVTQFPRPLWDWDALSPASGNLDSWELTSGSLLSDCRQLLAEEGCLSQDSPTAPGWQGAFNGSSVGGLNGWSVWGTKALAPNQDNSVGSVGSAGAFVVAVSQPSFSHCLSCFVHSPIHVEPKSLHEWNLHLQILISESGSRHTYPQQLKFMGHAPVRIWVWDYVSL